MGTEAVETIKPYQQEGSKREQVEQMFDSIAPAYDFMNRAMTLGIDRWWRRSAVKRVKRHLADKSSPQLLDVATGTGDFAIQLHKQIAGSAITGIDLSNGMLDVARQKVTDRHLEQSITFAQADCLALPFGDEQFDAVTVAFGVRNFEHIDLGYREMRRVLRPGGILCVLELSTPQNKFIRWFYDLYTMRIIPFIGSRKSGDPSAYRYLPQSIAAVPQGLHMLDIMRQEGFTRRKVTRLTFGTCSIYTAVKS